MQASKKSILARSLLGAAILIASASARGEVTPQRWSPHLRGANASLSLTGMNDTLTAWNALAPHLENATLVLEKENAARSVYRVFWENRWIYGAKLNAYNTPDGAPLLNGSWPDEAPACAAEETEGENAREIVWWISRGLCREAYVVSSRRETLVMARDTHEILLRESHVFDVTATVHTENVLDAKLQTVTLDDIREGEFLDYPSFSVFGRTTMDPRARALQGSFSYSPDQEPLFFDQVQTSFNAQRALQWFQRLSGWEHAGKPIEIFTNTDDLNNAFYLPAQGTLAAEVHLGRGDQINMRFLSRDADVVSHELSHHYIYQYVTTSRGESGIIHEGTADYLAYAIQGDPRLGDTVVPDAPFLRTALIPEENRFDDPDQDRAPHHLGQYWSALLWDLREKLGAEGDELLLQSLTLLPDHAQLTDAILALLHADSAIFPRSDEQTRGENYCLILNRAIARGFSKSIRDVDGSPCALDLATIAAARESEISVGKKSGSRDPLAQIIPSCGVITQEGRSSHWLTMLCLILPFFPLVFWRNREGT